MENPTEKPRANWRTRAKQALGLAAASGVVAGGGVAIANAPAHHEAKPATMSAPLAVQETQGKTRQQIMEDIAGKVMHTPQAVTSPASIPNGGTEYITRVGELEPSGATEQIMVVTRDKNPNTVQQISTEDFDANGQSTGHMDFQRPGTIADAPQPDWVVNVASEYGNDALITSFVGDKVETTDAGEPNQKPVVDPGTPSEAFNQDAGQVITNMEFGQPQPPIQQ